MRFSGTKARRNGIKLLVVMLLVAGATHLSICADKDVGENSNGQDDQGAKGSFISAEFDSTLAFVHTLTTGELSQNARDALVTLIDQSPAFQAQASTAPPHSVLTSNDSRYNVFKQDGSGVNRTYICEDDENYSVVGTYLATSKSKAIILQPSVSATPSVDQTGFYKLQLDLFHGSFVKQVNTVRPMIVADVIAAVEDELTAQGFSFTVIAGGKWEITKKGGYFLAARVEVTDTLLSDSVNCVGLDGTSGPVEGSGLTGGGAPIPPNIPALSEWGGAALAGLLVLGAAFLIYRRQRSPRS